jgi:hypothetical protein
MTKRRDKDQEPPLLLREAGIEDDAQLLEALLELSTPTKPSTKPPAMLRDRLLSTVSRPRLRFAPLYGSLGNLFDLGDLDLAAIFEQAATPGAWTKTPIPGTELIHLQCGPKVANADNGLVRIKAGMGFPHHRHLGIERVLVLDGAYRDAPSGKLFGPGDLHEMAADTAHSYQALPGSDLLLAVSVVSGVDVDGYGTLSVKTR